MSRHATVWTSEEEAELRSLYEGGMRVTEIADRLQRTVGGIYKHVEVLGMSRTLVPPKPHGPMTVKILELASRPEGMASKELPDPDRVTIRAGQLVREGKLFSATFGYRRVRYYTNPADRDKALSALPAQKPKTKERLGWGKDDPAHITSETKVTICPSPPRALRTNTHNVW